MSLPRKPARKPTPFELGFHEAASGKMRDQNPLPMHTDAADEWDSGWNVYTERNERMRWFDPKVNGPGTTDVENGITFLCLVIDNDGYYSHKPCKTSGLSMSGASVWESYDHKGVRVIKYAHVVMENPEQVNAMQAANNWIDR